MKRGLTIAIFLGLTVAVTGCQRFSGGRNYAAPLPATPTTPVGEGELSPLDSSAPPIGTTLDDPNSTVTTDLASTPVAEPSSALEIDRSDMLGGWKLTSSGDNCMAFMTLTTWSGGYRANTRGCSNQVLTSISAWDLNGKQVILKDAGGLIVAQLYATSAGQFNGQTSSGAAASLYR